ncbi:CRISPR-associated protein [Candidatus Magnetomorum sp. HK-1]|nr:CRISPR-associated protein [Candidatus Magnetomorum sp. HK-1]
MLKRLINAAQIDIDIIPIDPLLIKSGQATVGGVDMSFVRTWHTGKGEEPFIPGSSLKGMIRAYAEKICRSLKDKPVPVCLPYVKPGAEDKGEFGQASCGLRFDKYQKNNSAIPSYDIYKHSCPVCRLFGSHVFIGRLATSDAYLTETFKNSEKAVLEIRDGVAIDRITGGSKGGAKYDLEVLTRGEFGTSINIRNFERWQMGLIGLILRDMVQGQLRLGFGKSRGLGRFRVNITSFILSYYNKNITDFKGISAICEDEQMSYGFFKENTSETANLGNCHRNGLRYDYDITSQWEDILEPGVSDFTSFIKTNNWPNTIENYLKQEKNK